MLNLLKNQLALIHSVNKLIENILSDNFDISDLSIELTILYSPLMFNYERNPFCLSSIDLFAISVNQVTDQKYFKNMVWDDYDTQKFIDALLDITDHFDKSQRYAHQGNIY